MNPLRRLYLRLADPPVPFRFDPRLEELVGELCRVAPGERPVLNLGCGTTRYGGNVVNLDLSHFPGVDVCGDAERLPFRDEAFRGVLARGLLEHVRLAERARAELWRVLAADGFLYVEVPFLQPYHLSPEDHRRFTLPGLRGFLSGFAEQESGIQIGPFSTLAWVVREVMASAMAFGSPSRYRKILAFAGWATFWLRVFDRLVIPGPHVANAASAFYYLGRKRR